MVDARTLYRSERWFDLVERYANLARAAVVVLDDSDRVIAASSGCREMFAEADRWQDICRQDPSLGTTFSVPVALHENPIARVVVLNPDPGRPTRLAAQLLAEVIEARAYHEFEVNNLSEEILGKYEEVNLLYDLSEALAAIFEPEKVYDVVLERGIAVIGAQQAAVFMLDLQTQVLRLAAGRGLPADARKERQLSLGSGVIGTVAMTGEAVLLEKNSSMAPGADTESTPLELKAIVQPPLICAPIQAKDRMIGVFLMAGKKGDRMFTAGDLKLLSAIASLAAVSIYNSELVAELRSSERVKRELEIAESIQLSLLPRHPPRVPGLDLAGRCISAAKVGGDYYDFLLRPDGSIGVLIADVSGHSVGAALMMAVARSAIRAETKLSRSPAQVLRLLNESLYEDLDRAQLFISMFYALYDTRLRELHFANGGHCPPALWSEAEGCTKIDADGLLIGVLPQVEFAVGHRRMNPGDVAVLYTDGIIEAEHRDGGRYGQERLYHVLGQVHAQSANEILDAIFDDVTRFMDGRLQSDDLTVVVLKVLDT